MTVFRGSAYLWITIALTAQLTEAMVCLIGREPDSNAAPRYRWVIPVEDPCKCTEIRPGGINNLTPGRHFKVIYFDTLLVSKSPMEIRKWLNCSDASNDSKVKTELIGSVPASQSAVITTYVAGNAPATSDKPVLTSFTCLGRVNNVHYADPYDCTGFYHCDNGVAHHKQCSSGLHFSETAQVCVQPYDTNCVL